MNVVAATKLSEKVDNESQIIKVTSQNAPVTSGTLDNEIRCAQLEQSRIVSTTKADMSVIRSVQYVEINEEESSSSSFSSSLPDDSLLSSVSDTSDVCQDIDSYTSADDSVLKSPEPSSTSGPSRPQQTLPPFASLALGVCLSNMQTNSNANSNNEYGVKLPSIPLYSPAIGISSSTLKRTCASVRDSTSASAPPNMSSGPLKHLSEGTTRQPLGNIQPFSNANNISLSPAKSVSESNNLTRQSPRKAQPFRSFSNTTHNVPCKSAMETSNNPSSGLSPRPLKQSNSPKKPSVSACRLSHSINSIVSPVQRRSPRKTSPRKALGQVRLNSENSNCHLPSFADVGSNSPTTLRLPLLLPQGKENVDSTRANFQSQEVKLPVKLQMKRAEQRCYVLADSFPKADESREVKLEKGESQDQQNISTPKPKIWNPLNHVFDAKKFRSFTFVQDTMNSPRLASRPVVVSPQITSTPDIATRCTNPVESREGPDTPIRDQHFPSIISPVTTTALGSRPLTPSVAESGRISDLQTQPMFDSSLAHKRQQYLVQNYRQASPVPPKDSNLSPAHSAVPLLHTPRHPLALELRQSPVPEIFKDNFDPTKQSNVHLYKPSFPVQQRCNVAETKTIFSTNPFTYQKMDSQNEYSTLSAKRPSTPLFNTGKRFKSEPTYTTQTPPFNPLQQLASVCVDQGPTWKDNSYTQGSGHVPVHPTSESIRQETIVNDSNSSDSKTEDGEESNTDYANSSFLKMLQRQHGLQNIEFVNGGNGIKNPSFIAPKPADITNTHQDVPTVLNGSCRCKVCGKEFKLQRLLNRHLKCHSDVKRYLCTFCGKGFNDTFDLKRHTRIHTGVKPYKCNRCDKSFTQRCSLESHCRKVHNTEYEYEFKQRRNKMYVCEECGFSTDEAETYYIHLRQNHPNCPVLAKPHDKRHFKFRNDRMNIASRPRSESELKPESRNEGKLHIERFLSMR